MAASPDTINHETDARFWAQTGFRVGQKLDPSNPTDQKMIPIWIDIHNKVKAEDAAGGLVLTHEHPAVAQSLADAHVADQAAAAHINAAATAPDPQTAQQNLAAAAAATQITAQKTQEAAAHQPPTASPQVAHEAAQEAAKSPPPPSAAPTEHIAHEQAKQAGAKVEHHHHAHAQAQAQAQAQTQAATPTARNILEKETDARFWAQTHYRPGQKLDPTNPTDRTMMPVWLNIYRAVRAEDAAGKLVLTYNHPAVDQALADAHVADQAAAAHMDAAVAAPQAAQENLAAAATAAQIAAQKAREAAAHQPPTVSPQVAHEASREAAKNPPPARAPAAEHVAHDQARRAGEKAAEAHHHARRRPPAKSTVHPGKLNDHRGRATAIAHQAGAPYVLVIEHPDGTIDPRAFASRAELDAAYAQLSEHHDQYAYLAAFDLAASPGGPTIDSAGITAPPEHAEAPAAQAPAMTPATTPSEAPLVVPPPAEKKGMSKGAIIAIALGVVAAGGIAFAATRKKKPARKTAFVVAPRGSSVRSMGPA